jgi:hypothetical protein
MGHDRWLNLELHDSTGAPLSGMPYVLRLGAEERREGALDGAGRLHEPIPADCESVVLEVAYRRFELEIVGLPASDAIVGAQERLNHLHYFVGDADGELGRFTAAALRRFQRDHGLPITGELDVATARCLDAEHGS